MSDKLKVANKHSASEEIVEQAVSDTGSINRFAIEVIGLLGLGTLVYAMVALLLIA